MKLDIINLYTLLGWVFLIASLIGGLFYYTSPVKYEALLGFSAASMVCGIILLIRGYTRKSSP